MPHFINMTNRPSIEERFDFVVVNCEFLNEWLDLTMAQCFDKMSDMFEPIESKDPVVYCVNFHGNEEELSWVLDEIVRAGIYEIVPDETRTTKEMTPWPPSDVSDRIATIPMGLKRIANYKSITDIFTIQIKIDNQIVYNLVTEEK